ncbi:hypothetical protein GOP47_0022421 [Adiantum capillus-veneris]|uniref:GATA-type domain-containing protein n=1 Tax=Adiantum capillus-veneris TaxID=13818 RepID=A0A9D4Z615_ADICA|nr:hypothetical protein GOP47_0022421 [Adiantum capillus-veneris]
MRSNSNCIIRCTLDNMFRNSKQFSSSPPAQYDAGSCRASEAVDGHAQSISQPRASSSNDDYGLPKCKQFLNTDAHSRFHKAVDSPQDDLMACFPGIKGGSMAIQAMQCPNLNVHIEPEISSHAHAPATSREREIREYDFLRHMAEEERCPVLAHEDVDCTLHLGTVPSTTAATCDRGRNVLSISQELSTSMLDVRGISSEQQRLLAGGWVVLMMRCHTQEYDVGALHWGTASSSGLFMTRSNTLDGACMSTTLLRENTLDIDECGSSSRTSSNGSGNTIRDSTGMSRPREIREAYLGAVSAGNIGPPPKQWFQDGMAGVLAGSKLAGSAVCGNDGYRNLAAAAGASLAGQGGAFTTNVFSGTSKSSNSKEASSYVIRICAQCKTMRTPLWRNGPQGPKSLCNACGIRYKKEERRSAAAEDGKLLHQPDTSDQRPRSSSMDRTDDRRPALNIQDQRSRFCNDNHRPRLTPDTLDEPSRDQRPKFVDITDQPSRFLAARDKRPKLVNDSNYRSS